MATATAPKATTTRRAKRTLEASADDRAVVQRVEETVDASQDEDVADAVARPPTLAELHESLDVPGFRVEILQGRIVMSPSPIRRHNRSVRWLMAAFEDLCVKNDWDQFPQVTLDLAATEERIVPDLLICPVDDSADAQWLVPASEALLVAEVVSASSRKDDYEGKRDSCALNGVPLYLVIDPGLGKVSLFSQPSDRGYLRSESIPVGDELEIPDPFDFTLDTATMPVPPPKM